MNFKTSSRIIIFGISPKGMFCHLWCPSDILLILYVVSTFQRCFIFTPKYGEDEPIFWGIFFRWVGSTTNQIIFFNRKRFPPRLTHLKFSRRQVRLRSSIDKGWGAGGAKKTSSLPIEEKRFKDDLLTKLPVFFCCAFSCCCQELLANNTHF